MAIGGEKATFATIELPGGKMNDLHAPFFALARPSHLWFELDRFLLINVSSSFLLEYDTIPIF